MLRALMASHIISSLQIAQGYVINLTYTHLLDNIPPHYTQVHHVYLLLITLEQNFSLDNMT